MVGVADGDCALALAIISAAPSENRIAIRAALAEFMTCSTAEAVELGALRGAQVGGVAAGGCGTAALVHHAAGDDSDIDGKVHQIGGR